MELNNFAEHGNDAIGWMYMTSNFNKPSISAFCDWMNCSLSAVFSI
jgi:hypothetical protein